MADTFTINGVDTTLIPIRNVVSFFDGSNTVNHWLTDTFFRRRVDVNDKLLAVGTLSLDNPVAPYVSPCVEGRPMRDRGSANVQNLRFAYLKPKRAITPCKVYNKAVVANLRNQGIVGDGILSHEEALVVAQVEAVQQNHVAVDNRIELMAAEVLTTGKLVIESDDFEHYEIDFGRNAALDYSPAIAWDDVGATPVADIQEMVNLITTYGQVMPRVALTSSAVYATLIANADFKAAFQAPFQGVSAELVPNFVDGRNAQNMGTHGGIQFWVYDAAVISNSVTTRFIPADGFYLIGDFNGVVAQGMIENLHAYGQAMKYYDRQWYNEDPSVIFAMTESAPLTVLNNPNGVVGGRVFITP